MFTAQNKIAKKDTNQIFNNYKIEKNSRYFALNNHILISPLLILAITCFGLSLSTVHPTERQLPKTDFTVPDKFLASDFSSTALAIFLTCSSVRFPLWVTFFVFFLSLS